MQKFHYQFIFHLGILKKNKKRGHVWQVAMSIRDIDEHLFVTIFLKD